MPVYVAPSVPPPEIVPINRDLWFGFFEFAGDTACQVNCRLKVEQGAPWLTVRSLDGRPVYRYVAGTPDGDPDAIDRAVATANAGAEGVPVVAYTPRGASAVRLPDAVVGVECYRRADESVADFEGHIRDVVARCPRAVLIAQCYTSNHTLTDDLRSIPPVIARVARDMATVEAVLLFSGSGRDTGFQDHPPVQRDWRQVAATISTPDVPVIDVPPEEPLDIIVLDDDFPRSAVAPTLLSVRYRIDGLQGEPVEVWLTVNGLVQEPSTDRTEGMLTAALTEPGEYRIGIKAWALVRRNETGKERIVRVLPATFEPPAPPVPPPAPPETPPVVDADPATALRRKAVTDGIKQLYWDVLGREADPGGLAHYVGECLAGRMDLPAVKRKMEADKAGGAK